MTEPKSPKPGDAGKGDSGKAIIPASERVVNFYGDPIPVAQTDDGTIYVPLRPITDFLGLAFTAQRSRVNRDDVLAEEARQVVMARSDGRRVPMLALPLPLLPGWLFGVQVSRTNEDLWVKLRRYRRECFAVLWQAFKGEILPATPPAANLSGAALSLEIATAVQHLAQQQYEMELRVSKTIDKQDVMADYMRKFIQEDRRRWQQADQRILNLEIQLSSGATISEAQAAEVSLAVKNVGQRLVGRGDKNGYGKVYGELYRRYHVSAYKNLPAARYQEVIDWLAGWYDELAPDGQAGQEEPTDDAKS